jgi:hypothetical protein
MGMATFGDVFSTTAKVILALLIISAVSAVAIKMLGGAVDAVRSPQIDQVQESADETRNKMPQTRWAKGVAKAIKEHCVTDGMSEAEVLQSLSAPTEKTNYDGGEGGAWTWKLPAGECLQYEGDNCVKREERHRTIQFTAKGNVFKEGWGCISLDGRYFDNQSLFGRAE